MRERPYQQLIAWKEAHLLCLWIYKITSALPTTERFRLVDQMCRSAYSAPMNIAEGSSKHSKKERARFYEIAFASIEELHYQCLLCKELEYIQLEDFEEGEGKIARTSYLLSKLRSSCFT